MGSTPFMLLSVFMSFSLFFNYFFFVPPEENMLCLRALVDTNGWPRDVCSEPVLNWFSCFYALWNPAWSICMSTLHFLPAGSPWYLLCTDSLWGKCAQELIKVLPGSFLGSILLPLVSQCVASEGGHMRLADLLFFLIYLLLKFWLQWPCYCWQGCFTLYSRVSEASPLQSYLRILHAPA